MESLFKSCVCKNFSAQVAKITQLQIYKEIISQLKNTKLGNYIGEAYINWRKNFTKKKNLLFSYTLSLRHHKP